MFKFGTSADVTFQKGANRDRRNAVVLTDGANADAVMLAQVEDCGSFPALDKDGCDWLRAIWPGLIPAGFLCLLLTFYLQM